MALIWYVLSKNQKIRVLVIDDHAVMRDGLSAVVNAQSDMEIVGEAIDGREAIHRFRDLRPDIALLDWNLPVVHGEEVLSTLKSETPEAQFIVISALNSDDCIRRALSLGARSYLHKELLRRELLPAIRTVFQGQHYLPDSIASRLKFNR